MTGRWWVLWKIGELEKVKVGMVRKFCIILFGPVSGIWAVADKP
jgi:hypothetical protein